MSKMSTYKAMITSLVCTFLCVAMLCGMTYAWYLTTIDSGENTIKIGTYDVTVKYSDTYSSITTTLSNNTVVFNVSDLGPGDFTVRYFEITNNTDYPAKADIYVTPDTTNETDVVLYAAAVSGVYTPTGSGTALSGTAALKISGDGFTVPARTGNTTGKTVVAVALKLPVNSTAVNKTSEFTVRIDVQQQAKS